MQFSLRKLLAAVTLAAVYCGFVLYGGLIGRFLLVLLGVGLCFYGGRMRQEGIWFAGALIFVPSLIALFAYGL